MLIERGDTMIQTRQIASVTTTHGGGGYISLYVTGINDNGLAAFHGEDAWAMLLALRLRCRDANDLDTLRKRTCGVDDHRPQVAEWQDWRNAGPYVDENTGDRIVPVLRMVYCARCGYVIEPQAQVRTEVDREI